MQYLFNVLVPLFRSIIRKTRGKRTVIIVDDDSLLPPVRIDVPPGPLRTIVWSSVALYTLVVALLISFTPLSNLIPGYSIKELRQSARLAAVRLEGLEDSLSAQEAYITNLQSILTGEFDSTTFMRTEASPPIVEVTRNTVPKDPVLEPISEDWRDHEYPALPMARLRDRVIRGEARDLKAGQIWSSFQLPVLPPVSGFITRGFSAQDGHFAIDIATEAGTMVRCIGDGYVIFADWTYTGGHTIIVQHADGYISVYKHNQRLLKGIGDRVRARESVAVSGDSGEYTTGPHLHFELWNNGLAQDPSAYGLGF